MSLSTSSLRAGIHAEHHDEAAFLYTQLARLRFDAGTPFGRLLDFERRLVAHVDALVLGGPAASRTVADLHDDSEPGHWYVAALLACRQRDDALVENLVCSSAAGCMELKADCHAAVVDALRHAMPFDWNVKLSDWIERAGEPLAAELAELAVTTGVACQAALQQRAPSAGAYSGRLVRALGRAGAAGPASTWLIDRAGNAHAAPVRRDALLALANLGAPQAPALARQFVDQAQVSHRALGLIGGREDAHRLVRYLAARPAHAETLIALGLLGDLAAVRPLIALLAHETLAAVAADALEWITGAGLRETVLESHNGKPLAEGAYLGARVGTKVGTNRGQVHKGRLDETAVERVCRNPDAWLDWLDEAAPEFVAGRRYRFGKSWTPQVLVDSLAEEHCPCSYRQLAFDELAMRLAAPQRLDLRFSVSRQMALLQALQAWARRIGTGQEIEQWPYAGLVAG